MISQIKITNHLSESITLTLGSPEKSGLFVRFVDLGPSKADVNVAQSATGDGGVVNSTRVNSRNILLSLGFLEKPTIEDARQLIYKYLPIKKMVTVEVHASNRICKATGYVESSEMDIFSKQSGCTVSILCPDAYLYSPVESLLSLMGQDVLFEFPFSNESLSQPLIEFSNFTGAREGVIEYVGDVPVGITINIHATGDVTGLRIANLTTTQLVTIDDTRLIEIMGSGISSGDDIIISSVRGNKFARLVRSGVTYDILYALGSNPSWFVLESGDNAFTYLADTGLSNLEFRINNLVAYEGI